MKYDFLHIGFIIAITVGTILLAYLVNRFFNRLIRRSTEEMASDPTNYHFLRYIVVALVYVTGFSIVIYSVPSLRALASSLLAGAGILTVAVGFASQQALSNIIGGVFIIVFRPFRIKDRLKLKEFTGIVEDITLRHTVIRDFENKRIIIPNSIISNEIIVNADFADGKVCKFIDFGISYDSDIDKAKEIMVEEIKNHALHIDPRKEAEIAKGDPEIPVRVISLGDSAVNLRAWTWAKDSADGFVLSCDLLETIKKRFDKEGIDIPFPHRTLLYKEKK